MAKLKNKGCVLYSWYYSDIKTHICVYWVRLSKPLFFISSIICLQISCTWDHWTGRGACFSHSYFRHQPLFFHFLLFALLSTYWRVVEIVQNVVIFCWKNPKTVRKTRCLHYPQIQPYLSEIFSNPLWSMKISGLFWEEVVMKFISFSKNQSGNHRWSK